MDEKQLANSLLKILGDTGLDTPEKLYRIQVMLEEIMGEEDDGKD